MCPIYFDGGVGSAVSPWLNTTDCKPAAGFDDRSTSWSITPLNRTLSTPAHFPAGAYPSPQTSTYTDRHSSPTSGLMARCDVMESPLTSYSCMTPSLGNPHFRSMLSSSSADVDNALMSAALLHSAAASKVNMMKNLPEQRTNTGVLTGDSASTAAAAALRLRTKSHSSSGNSFSPFPTASLKLRKKLTYNGYYPLLCPRP